MANQKVVPFFFLTVILLGSCGLCEITYWTGGASLVKTNWLDPDNWNNGVPGKHDHAIIHNHSTFFPVISSDVGQVHYLSPSWHGVDSSVALQGNARLRVSYLFTLGNEAGGLGTLHMNGGYLIASTIRVGVDGTGRVNLHGGRVDADTLEFGQELGTGSGTIEIRGGRLTLMDDKTVEVAAYVSAGWILAYNGYGRVYYDFHKTTPGRTTVMAVSSLFKAWQPVPSKGKQMSQTANPVTVQWSAGDGAVWHDVYVGTDESLVSAANTSDTSGIYRGRQSGGQYTLPETLAGYQTIYWRIDEVQSGGGVTKGDVWSFTTAAMEEPVDLYSDTWVAVDGLGRQVPGFEDCGPVRENRTVGVYYCVWHKRFPAVGPYDNTKMIAENPENPDFHYAENLFWWGEPEIGYYFPDDRWAIRRNLSMLVDAGADVLIFEATNAIAYVYESLTVCDVLAQMQSEGLATDVKVCFWTHTSSPATVTTFYNQIYAQNLFPELWFYWEGKPLILGYPDGSPFDEPRTPVSQEIRDFFTWRKSWYDIPGGPHSNDMHHEWQWGQPTPQDYGWDDRADVAEEVPVAAASHPIANIGKSYVVDGGQPALNELDLPVDGTEGHGLYFEEQSLRMLELDPEFLWITGWNEWIMGWFLKEPGVHDGLEFLGEPVADGEYYSVDSYNPEYNRDLEPMKGGYGDNYYYHMINTIRRYKGVRPPQVPSVPKTISIDGTFADWTEVAPEFRDTAGDTAHRKWYGFGFTDEYTNATGRNDIVSARVARDDANVYFYVRTREPMTPHTDPHWMMLFVNADQDYGTGWQGYDYVVNQQVIDSSVTTLKQSASGWNWNLVSNTISYRSSGHQMEIAVPRSVLGLSAEQEVQFDFHWADTAAIMPKHKCEYAFSVDGTLQGWDMIHSIANAAASGGILSLDVIGADPYMHSPQWNVYAARNDYVRIRMRNHTAATSGQLYWITLDDPVWNEAKHADFAMTPNDSVFREYVIDLSQHPQWNGVVRQIRLDPGDGSLGQVEIDFIETYAHPESLDWGLDGDHAPNQRFNYRYDTTVAHKACEQWIAEGGGDAADLDQDCMFGLSDLILLADQWLAGGDLMVYVELAVQWLDDYTPETIADAVVLDEDFESGSAGWSTNWDLTTSYFYSANASIECSSNDNDLVSPAVDVSPYSSLVITFHYRLSEIESNDNIKVWYFDGSVYQEVADIGAQQHDTWLHYSDTLHGEGGDSVYFHDGFRLKVTGSGVDFGEAVWVDDVKMIGIR